MDTWLNRGSADLKPLISRVITVEIEYDQNACEASDKDPTEAFSRRFKTHQHVASSRASDCDRMAIT